MLMAINSERVEATLCLNKKTNTSYSKSRKSIKMQRRRNIIQPLDAQHQGAKNDPDIR